MIELLLNDFRPLDTFPLSWRWIHERISSHYDEDLMQFQPLQETTARELWSRYCDRDRYIGELGNYVFGEIPEPLPSMSLFELISRIDADQDRINVTIQKLQLLGLPTDENVIVHWEPELAAVGPWKVLQENWYDFCCPCSDDNCIYPISEAWF